jgi:uncharacterized membrane protein
MNMQMFWLVFHVIFISVYGALILFTSPNKAFLFGVRIPPGEAGCAEAVHMKKRFRAAFAACTLTVLVGGALQILFFYEWPMLPTLYFLGLVVALSFVYTAFWKKAKRLKEARGWVVPHVVFADTRLGSSHGKWREIPWALYALSLAVLGVSSWIKYSYWDFVITFVLVIMATLLFTNIFFVRGKMQVNPQTPLLSYAQHRVYRKRLGYVLGGTVLLLSVVAAFTGFSYVLLFSALLYAVPMVITFVVSGQGGSKIKIANPPVEDMETPHPPVATEGRGDDEFWLLGTFYYNPDDPTLFIEPRAGTDITLNFARWPVKIGTALFVLFIIVAHIHWWLYL